MFCTIRSVGMHCAVGEKNRIWVEVGVRSPGCSDRGPQGLTLPCSRLRWDAGPDQARGVLPAPLCGASMSKQRVPMTRILAGGIGWARSPWPLQRLNPGVPYRVDRPSQDCPVRAVQFASMSSKNDSPPTRIASPAFPLERLICITDRVTLDGEQEERWEGPPAGRAGRLCARGPRSGAGRGPGAHGAPPRARADDAWPLAGGFSDPLMARDVTNGGGNEACPSRR